MTDPFLQLVAQDLRRRKVDFAHTTVVFPNKRAALFFIEYLAVDEKAVWAPRFCSIGELFSALSPLTAADPIETICRMYRIYADLAQTSEPLDLFYGWGERLLSDFEQVDKAMADAERLFVNVKDYNAIDFGNFLSDEQRTAIEQAFTTAHASPPEGIRERYFAFWNLLLPLYNQLNAALKQDGKAYEGAIFREVAERLSAGEDLAGTDSDLYVFVGFNALDKVEEVLFKHFQQAGRALFYWDYDRFYLDDTAEAGRFLRQNLRQFPNALAEDCFDNFHDKDFCFVAAQTENEQAAYATQWLNKHLTDEPKRTAIVLCDEQLLEPTLHALPPSVAEANITKGFPLTHTSAYSLMESFFEAEAAKAETAARSSKSATPPTDTGALLAQLSAAIQAAAQQADATAEAAGATPSDNDRFRQLSVEAFFQSYTIIERLRGLVESGMLTVTPPTLHRLIRRLAAQASIPFHGEPVAGLQLMGILETRNLDFENILLLSTNEGIMPASGIELSFIPFAIRRAFGLPSTTHRSAVYAYYFFRLLQRARHVTFTYNATPDGLRGGEMSRFMMQLLVSGRFRIRQEALNAPRLLPQPTPIEVARPADLFERLNPVRDGQQVALSPSSINKYIDCPLQFYYHRVARLTPHEDTDAALDNRIFGNVFHQLAEDFYKPFEGKGKIDPQRLAYYHEHPERLNPLIEEAFAKNNVPYRLVDATIVRNLFRRMLAYDYRLADLEIVRLECDVDISLPLKINGTVRPFNVGGRIDRLDIARTPSGLRTLRVVDYKTGTKEQKANKMEDLFIPKKSRPYYIFQTFLYALAVQDKVREFTGEDLPVSTVLFHIPLINDAYDPWIPFAKERVYDFGPLASDFREQSIELLQRMMDTPTFRQTDDLNVCAHCDFQQLCERNVKSDY